MPPTLTIMTYNTRGALYDDGPNNWPYRAPLNVRLLQQHTPDLIGFQEVHPENLAILPDSHLGYAQFTGNPYDNHPPYQYNAIAWNPQRLRLIDSGGFWLSETPDRHSGSWGTDCIRCAAWVKLEWLETGLMFLHLNTHLDHISEHARVEGAKLIVRFLDTVGLPLAVTGDFNCPPTSAAYHYFAENGFLDTYIVAGNKATRWTYHGYHGQAYIPHKLDYDRIDWILVRDWGEAIRVNRCDILEDAQPPLYPSDHYPVMAAIQKEPAPAIQ